MTYKVCIHVFDDKTQHGDKVTTGEVVNARIYTSRTRDGANAMIATLSNSYTDSAFEVVSDGPTVELEEFDRDLYDDLRHAILKPVYRASSKFQPIVIEGGAHA